MSYPDPNNPFAASQVPPTWPSANLPPKPGQSFEYMRIFTYVFDNPNWLMNLVWGFLCILSGVLIPIVGQLLLLGYQFEVIDSLLASRDRRYVDFDLNRFGEYLGRSVWPFLVQLVATLVIMCAMLIVIGIPVGLLVVIAISAGEDAAPPILIIGGMLIALLTIPISIFMSMALIPMAFRAGMTCDFSEGFNFAWVKDYLRRVWLELFLATLFLAVAGFLISICAFLACVLPLFFVQPLVTLAGAHLMFQIYSIYLARGGEPIPARVIAQPVPLPQPQPQPPTF